MKQNKNKGIEEQFPNEAKFVGGEERTVNEGNYFEYEELWKFRKRFMKFNVLMELLHETLELDKETTTMEQLVFRIQDAVIASRREK